MATPAAQLDQILTSTFFLTKKTFVDQITHETALLAYLNAKSAVTEDGGESIRRPVMYALNSTVGSYDSYDPINTTPQGGWAYATYNWRQFAGSVTISGREERINSGKAQIFSLISAKIDQLRVSIEQALNPMLFADGTGNSGKDLLGLQAIVTDSGVLGGIDPSDATWWKSQVRGVVGGANGADLTSTAGVKSLNNLLNSLAISKSRPDLELTTQANFEAYEALAVPDIRFTSLQKADLGFVTVAHKNAVVVFDPDVPAPSGSLGGFWYMLNSDRLEFVKHSQAWMDLLPFARPVNQDAKTALNISMGNLITDCRRAHGVVKRVQVA
jgi:hypothetical protein